MELPPALVLLCAKEFLKKSIRICFRDLFIYKLPLELEQKVALGNPENIRIDSMLESEQQSEDGEDEAEDEKRHLKQDGKKGNDGVPTIEMTVALGDFDSNPLVSLLEEDKNVSKSSEANGDKSKGIFLNEAKAINDHEDSAHSLLSAHGRSAKKPLIQEI